MTNNPRIFQAVVSDLQEHARACVRVSGRPHAAYGLEEFTTGMVRGALDGRSVAGRTNGVRLASGSSCRPKGSRRSPLSEWFRLALKGIECGEIQECFDGSVSS